MNAAPFSSKYIVARNPLLARALGNRFIRILRWNKIKSFQNTR